MRIVTLLAATVLAGAPAFAQPSPDSDGDGKVSKAEWAATGRPEQAFTAADTNKDGFVDKAEMQVVRANADPDDVVAGAMAKMDTDRSGGISKAEWTAAGRRDRGFGFADANGDGQVNAAELKVAMEKMQARGGAR